MQNDLISRSKLLEKLEEDKVFFQRGANADALFAFRTSDSVIKLVKAQPIAYNIERVIRLLEKELELADIEKLRCSNENPLQFDSAKGYATGISNALDIIRKGGVNNATN